MISGFRFFYSLKFPVVYYKLGRYEEALVQYGKAQEVYVAVYGDMHLAIGTGRDVLP